MKTHKLSVTPGDVKDPLINIRPFFIRLLVRTFASPKKSQGNEKYSSPSLVLAALMILLFPVLGKSQSEGFVCGAEPDGKS